MRAALLSPWGLPLVLAALLNTIRFSWIPFLSRTGPAENPGDFTEPVVLFDHKPIETVVPKNEPRRIARLEEPARQTATPKPTQDSPPQRTVTVNKQTKPQPREHAAPWKKAPPSPARAPVMDAPADEKSDGPGISSYEPAAVHEVSSGSGSGAGEGASGTGLKSEYGIGEVDLAPVVVEKTEPPYPPLARRKNIEGKVMVRFLVDKGGRVQNLSVVQATPQGVFEGSALEAIRKWRFKPGIYRGQAVSTWVALPIHFRITD